MSGRSGLRLTWGRGGEKKNINESDSDSADAVYFSLTFPTRPAHVFPSSVNHSAHGNVMGRGLNPNFIYYVTRTNYCGTNKSIVTRQLLFSWYLGGCLY